MMTKTKYRPCILLAALLAVVLSVGMAQAYQLTVTGRWIWGYDYIDQGGEAGFFGPYNTASDLVAPGNPHFRAYNAWVGARTINGTQYGMVRGADASLQWMRAEVEPEFRINNAIRIRGLYEIGSLNPYAASPAQFNGFSLYPTATFYGTHTGFAWGKWNQLWMTVQTPWGIIVAGKRASGFGIGSQRHAQSYNTESLSLVAEGGPFRYGVTLSGLHRPMTWTGHRDDQASVSAAVPQGAAITLSDGTVVAAAQGAGNRLLWERVTMRNLQPGAFITYRSGSLDMGVLYQWYHGHQGPGQAATYGGGQLGANGGARNMNTYDTIFEEGVAYFKFNNGRFALNGEIDWVRTANYTQPSEAALSNLATPAVARWISPKYLESWKYALEACVFSGPAKVSFLWSYVPGPDRRAGIWIDRQAWENQSNGVAFGNPMFFLPYSLLMSYQYGAGLLALDNRGEGYMTDAVSYGARLDYAVAANLNASASFFMAQRQSRGWGWGCLTLAGLTPRVVLLGGGGQPAAPQNKFWGEGENVRPAPNIPDDNLGWEVTAGVDWKILEGLTVNLRGAYWHVGEWFKFACIDKNFVAAGGAVVGNVFVPGQGDGVWGWAVNPSRNIDPIYMFQGVMTVDF